MSLNEKYSYKTSSDTLSVASRTTSDYFPQSYKRPAPYLLWDDNIVPIHFPNSSTPFSCCRLFLGLLITFAVLGVIVVISVAVYLGVITSNLMEEVNNEHTFDGRIRITQGDNYVPELEDPSSLEFQLKAKKYETMINMLLKESALREGYKETEVTGFRLGSLLVFFRVNLDRRKMPFFKPDELANTIQDVIVSEATSANPRVLKGVRVDHGSISIWDSYPKKKFEAKRKSVHLPPQNLTSSKSTESVSMMEMLSTTVAISTPVEATTQNTPVTKQQSSNIQQHNDTTQEPWTTLTEALSESTSIPTTTARGSAEKPIGKHPEVLMPGVAHEIAFSLDDLSFHETGLPKQSAPMTSAANAGAHPMDANVAALLVLRTPMSERNGKDLADGRDGAHTTSRSLRRPLRRPQLAGSNSGTGGLRITSAPIRREMIPAVTEVNVNVRLNLRKGSRPGLFNIKTTETDFSQDNAKESIFSRIPPLIALDPVTETPEEDTSDGSKKTVQSGSLNSNSFLDEGWVTVPLKRHTFSFFTQRTSPTPMFSELLELIKKNLSTSTDFPTGESVAPDATDDQSDPMMAEEQNIQPEAVKISTDLVGDTHEELIIDNGCSRAGAFQCKTGGCVSQRSRCDQVKDCPDNSDEDGCTCADKLKSQFLKEKICDGVVDCWDYSDENQCSQCTPGMYICPNTNICINKKKVCDSLSDCPGGEDEKNCVRISPNLTVSEELFYHTSGYLMLRKNGLWGRLCVDNMSLFGRRTSSPMSLTDVARAVCRSLTFTDYVAVERKKAPLVPRSFDNEETFYEVRYVPSNINSTTRSVLEFNNTYCRKREVAWIQCKNLECGTRPMASSARIVGGANARAGNWPWQAAMYKSGEYMCGATLINDQWLLSAAHCFYNEVNNHWTARLGMLRRGSQAPHEQIHQISHIIIHPNYVKVGFINDVAMLRLQTKVTFSDYIRPVCLPSSAEDSIINGQMCTVVGWGQLMETGHVFPDTLQEVELPVYDTEECRKKTVFLQTYQITENMFCAGYDRGGRDACLGDSGGPLVCQKSTGQSSLVGITSNGFGCARAYRPGIYTKVANYLTWMDQVMASPLRNPIRTYCRGHRCQLGKCLSASSVCNGYVECLDGSDEHGCS